jgi:glycosyltransferase involved in cell wall biosynthesis
MSKKELASSFVSIIIPCRNEERYIATCLDSLLNTTYPHDCLEILIIDGMSEDSTSEIISRYLHNPVAIHRIENPDHITPKGLNIGIKAAKGDFIIILSAHANYPANYAENLITEAIRLNADCTGPLLQTQTVGTTDTSKAIINVLSDPLGVGSHFRTGVATITEVDTVAFGCYSKEVFKKYGLFDERLIRNQDIELNKRIVRGGGKIYLLPDVTCTYYARETYIELAKNNYQNGYWNILTAYYTEILNSLSLRHFIPLIFVLALLMPLIASPFYPPLLKISASILFLYLIIISGRAWKIKKGTTWLHQIVAFVVLHFSYGFGSIGGIIAVIKQIILKAYL